MTDTFSREKRSQIMSRVRSKDTRPELIVRSMLHRMGYRFRLHRRDLPGTPDIVLPKLRVAIFVNGCFWHGHLRCKRASIPSTNTRMWKNKISRNATRDASHRRLLARLGWKVIVLWQCEVRKETVVRANLQSKLNSRALWLKSQLK